MGSAEIARLTDWQVTEFYLKPAAERAERLRREMPTETRHAGTAVYEPGPDEPPPPEPGTPAFRLWCVNKFVAMGMTPEAAAAQFDRQNAEWLAQQKG